MDKMRYKIFSLFGIVLLGLLCINLISANIIIGNISGDIDIVYGPSQILRGWINVSLNNEPIDSLLSVFDSSIKLIDFLKNNSQYNYNCTTSDCSETYDAVNGETQKNLVMSGIDSKTIGLKLSGTLTDNPIKDVSFNVNSNVDSKCSQQLKIDIADDNALDWIPTNWTNDFSCSISWGCYDPSQILTDYKISSTAEYCEKIRVPAASAIKVGAYIIKNNTNNGIKMSVYDIDTQKIGECQLPQIDSNGEYSCIINNLGFINESDVYVCIKGSTDYKIKGESAGDICGFFDLENHNGYVSDYSIFAQAGKYTPIGSFVLNENSFKKYDSSYSGSLTEYLNDYLDFKYNNNCNNGCAIPIRFFSFGNQDIIVSNLTMEYTTTSGILDEKKFYEINKKTSRLSSDFLKLDLSKAGFKVPSDIGNRTVSVSIGDAIILRKEIQIRSIPQIKSITPTNLAALVPTNFLATMDISETNMTYKWNFGDNSSEETTSKNTITHSYPKIGSYKLTLKAVGKNGETSRTFDITAVSPKNLINGTILNYETEIKKVEDKINNLTGFVKTEAIKGTNLSDLKDIIASQKKSYQDGYIDDNKALQIMKTLVSLKVPNEIYVSKILNPSEFFMNEDEVDINRLSDLGAGKSDKSRREYLKGIFSWIRDNIKITAESKEYSVSFVNRNDEALFTDLKMNLEPKENIKELYFVINGDPDKIVFSADLNTKIDGNSVAIILTELSEARSVEFLYPETIDPLAIPVYISPEFKYLDSGIVISDKCNMNGACEENLDENYNNCSDCKKPWLMTAIIWIIVLLIAAFIVYIILQEWYKRYYEKHLFPDRNNLYNLINFVNNSEIQGVSKSMVFKKLKEMGWTNEQLNYSWNKLHGKRTGMWEIPIFKRSENKKVREELQKRQQIGKSNLNRYNKL